MTTGSPSRVSTATTTFKAFRFGSSDPTVRIETNRLVIASHTPLGPGWLVVDDNGIIETGGPGAPVIVQRRPDPAGARDDFVALTPVHPVVERLQHTFGAVRMGSSADVYKASLTATLGQRITAGEATRQWAGLCRTLSTPIDTPCGSLLSPPDPDVLAGLVPYQLHPLGIEESRATTLIALGKVFARPGAHQTDPHSALQRIRAEVPRFGRWTQALVEAEALGDPDAVAIGDFHLKNVVAHALCGKPRGTDDEMLAALVPYAGQRGRVLMWLSLGGIAAPKFGPRRRNIDIRRF